MRFPFQIIHDPKDGPALHVLLAKRVGVVDSSYYELLLQLCIRMHCLVALVLLHAFGGQHLHGRRLGEADEAERFRGQGHASSRCRQSRAERRAAEEGAIRKTSFGVLRWASCADFRHPRGICAKLI